MKDDDTKRHEEKLNRQKLDKTIAEEVKIEEARQKKIPGYEKLKINFSLNTFSEQITICQICFEIYTSSLSNKFIFFASKSKYWNYIWVFPFLISFSC